MANSRYCDWCESHVCHCASAKQDGDAVRILKICIVGLLIIGGLTIHVRHSTCDISQPPEVKSSR